MLRLDGNKAQLISRLMECIKNAKGHGDEEDTEDIKVITKMDEEFENGTI